MQRRTSFTRKNCRWSSLLTITFLPLGLIELPRSISPAIAAKPAKLPSGCNSFPSGFEKVVAVGNGAVNIGQSSHKLLRHATFTTTNASECSSRVSSNAVDGAIICAYPLNDSAVFTDDAGRLLNFFQNLLEFYSLEAP